MRRSSSCDVGILLCNIVPTVERRIYDVKLAVVGLKGGWIYLLLSQVKRCYIIYEGGLKNMISEVCGRDSQENTRILGFIASSSCRLSR